jgi:hypothetical protein
MEHSALQAGAAKVKEAVAPLAHQPEVKVQKNWYY